MSQDNTDIVCKNDLTFAPECIQTDLNYNNSGQRPAASGQRPAASGQRPHDARSAPGRGAQAGFPDLGGLATV